MFSDKSSFINSLEGDITISQAGDILREAYSFCYLTILLIVILYLLSILIMKAIKRWQQL
jgi:hypothetical protein